MPGNPTIFVPVWALYGYALVALAISWAISTLEFSQFCFDGQPLVERFRNYSYFGFCLVNCTIAVAFYFYLPWLKNLIKHENLVDTQYLWRAIIAGFGYHIVAKIRLTEIGSRSVGPGEIYTQMRNFFLDRYERQSTEKLLRDFKELYNQAQSVDEVLIFRAAAYYLSTYYQRIERQEQILREIGNALDGWESDTARDFCYAMYMILRKHAENRAKAADRLEEARVIFAKAPSDLPNGNDHFQKFVDRLRKKANEANAGLAKEV